MPVNSIFLIGAGNVATHLGLALQSAGKSIAGVYSRTELHASALADKLACPHFTDLSALPDADLYLFAVRDDALTAAAEHANLRGKLVAHTSGTQPMAALQSASDRTAVFYPLQTFSIGKPVDMESIPFCIEAANQADAAALYELAGELSNSVHFINSEQRKQLHIAAVFACNFSNHLYSISAQLLERHNMSLDLLKPLIRETANKITDNDPAAMQTGPAKRGDHRVIQQHLAMLQHDADWQQLYRLFSQLIADQSNK